jgi:hypothetical protein
MMFSKSQCFDMRNSHCIPWLLLALSASASGQVYKIVGADGKITYSDRPPLEASASVQLLKGGVPTSVPARGPAVDTGRGTGAGRSALLPGVEATLHNVALTETATAACSEEVPSSTKHYAAAKAQWRSRNRAVLERTDKVLASEFPGQRARLEADARRKVDAVFMPIFTSDAARRVRWCEEAVDAFTAIDLARFAEIIALMDDKPH